MTLSDLIISGHSCLLVVGLVRYKGKENDFQVLAFLASTGNFLEVSLSLFFKDCLLFR